MERIAWLRAYHRSHRAGLDGPTGEATWAVVDGVVSGQVRLKRLVATGEVEVGLWVRRGVRRNGVGTKALRLAMDLAGQAGFRAVRAETTSANGGAQAVLKRHGFVMTADARRVSALATIGHQVD